MESCVERVQVVHLLLARGGDDCEIAKHLSRKCAPSPANERPLAPEDAAFRDHSHITSAAIFGPLSPRK